MCGIARLRGGAILRRGAILRTIASYTDPRGLDLSGPLGKLVALAARAARWHARS